MIVNKEKNFISAVVYVHNEENRIFSFLERLNRVLKNTFEKYEIICVNDASLDNSLSEIKRFAKLSGGGIISVLNMSFYQGLELSMNAGIDLAIGDFVYEFDTIDINYTENMIVEIYERSLKGYDIVSAAPQNNSGWCSSLFYWIYNKAAKAQYHLRTDSFRILSRRAINRVHAMSKTIPYRKALYVTCGLKMDTISYESIGERKKRSREDVKMQRLTASNAIVLFTDLIYKCSLAFSVVMMTMLLLIGAYTVVTYLKGRPVEGWTTTMLFLVFGFLGMFVIMTMVIKYLSVILSISFNRQKYVVESIEKLNN